VNKDRKYLIYLGILASVLLIVFLTKNKQYDWRITFAHDDKNPYGAFALNEILSTSQKVVHCYKTFYELNDSITSDGNLFIIAERFTPDKEDAKAMINFAQRGGNLLIAANHIYGNFADTLEIKTTSHFISAYGTTSQADSTFLRLSNHRLDTANVFYFQRDDVNNYFTRYDTSVIPTKKAKPMPLDISLLTKNDDREPAAIRIRHGKGQIILISTPMIFTNILLLRNDNHRLVSSLLSYLPQKKTYWTEFYQLGRMEFGSPLRVVLETEPLRWAYYLVIGSILIFILVEIKRKQRAIPVIKPLANTTLEFVKIISSLYYEKADHKSVAMKKIRYFNESVRNKYNFTLSIQATNYVTTLSLKAGVSENIVQRLSDSIQTIISHEKISHEELSTLVERIQEFWKK